MGKLANNERIKLKATYLNNVASGLALGGVFLPLFVLMPKAGEMARRLVTVDLKVDDFLWFLATIVAVIIAFTLSEWARSEALLAIEKLED